MDATPHECVFVDDRVENVDAARDVGLAAHLFTGAEALAAALDSRAGVSARST